MLRSLLSDPALGALLQSERLWRLVAEKGRIVSGHGLSNQSCFVQLSAWIYQHTLSGMANKQDMFRFEQVAQQWQT